MNFFFSRTNGGVKTFFGFSMIDYRPDLRGADDHIARITKKQFSGDAGFGDCPMFIEYEFHTEEGLFVQGRFESTESSFYHVEVGDDILVRYSSQNPHCNAPRDAILLIKSIGR